MKVEVFFIGVVVLLVLMESEEENWRVLMVFLGRPASGVGRGECGN